jgi:hypothetical protein
MGSPRSATWLAAITLFAALGASCTSPSSPVAHAPTARQTTATPSPSRATPPGARPTNGRRSTPTVTATQGPTETPVTPTLLPATVRASAGRMAIRVDEADARTAALEMVAGGSEPRVEWVRLISGDQWRAIAESDESFNAWWHYGWALDAFPVFTGNIALYVAKVSAYSATPPPGDNPAAPSPPGRRTRFVVIDARDGAVLARKSPVTDPMEWAILHVTPPAPVHALPRGQLAALRRRATPTQEPEFMGVFCPPGETSAPSGITHTATLTEVVKAVAWRPGARWTYVYSADELLPPRYVTHTVLSLDVAAPDSAVVHIGTEGGPAFMAEWLLVDHGNVFFGNPQSARAWQQGRVATPTGQEPYVRLPPPSQPLSWNYDAPFAGEMRPCGRVPNGNRSRACRITSGYQCSELGYGLFYGGFVEVICPGVGWSSHEVHTRYGEELWWLVRFDPGPGADPAARATAAAFLATPTPTTRSR